MEIGGCFGSFFQLSPVFKALILSDLFQCHRYETRIRYSDWPVETDEALQNWTPGVIVQPVSTSDDLYRHVLNACGRSFLDETLAKAAHIIGRGQPSSKPGKIVVMRTAQFSDPNEDGFPDEFPDETTDEVEVGIWIAVEDAEELDEMSSGADHVGDGA